MAEEIKKIPLPPWCRKAKIAMAMQDLHVDDVARAVGYTRQYTSSVLNGGSVRMPARKKISDFLNITDADELDLETMLTLYSEKG